MLRTPKSIIVTNFDVRATTTVLPPFALSTLVSYVPQKGIPRTGHNTRYACTLFAHR